MSNSEAFELDLRSSLRIEVNTDALDLDSTLNALPLYQVRVESSVASAELNRLFQKYPSLPGVLLLEQGEFIGMLSRQRFQDYLLRPQGLELFLNQPLEVLYSYARTQMMVLPGSTPIVTAAPRALRRPSELLGEPIVVQVEPQFYQLLDIHELNIAYWQIRGIETQVRYERSQAQMIQSDKMASLGRLVDGLAHEVLDPVSFIWGNLTFVTTYTQDLLKLLDTYEAIGPAPTSEILAIQEEVDLEFLRQDLPRALESVRAGAERLSKLATSLQNFCHIDEVYPKPIDLHTCLDNILLLLKSRLTTEIQIVKNYGYLPPVQCYPGQLNQVLINLLSHAVDTLLNKAVRQQVMPEFRDSVPEAQPNRQPCIQITTEVRSLKPMTAGAPDSRWIALRIADNGPGMTPEQQQQLQDSFSIEKRAAKETSLGISYQIITARHGGKFLFHSEPEVGTEFEILLPLA